MTSSVEVRTQAILANARSCPFLLDLFLYAFTLSQIARAALLLVYEWRDPLVAVVSTFLIVASIATLVVLLMPEWLARFLARKGFPKRICP